MNPRRLATLATVEGRNDLLLHEIVEGPQVGASSLTWSRRRRHRHHHPDLWDHEDELSAVSPGIVGLVAGQGAHPPPIAVLASASF